MTDSLYWLILLVIDGVIMFMGLTLIFGATPAKLKGTPFHQARIFMGLAFIVSPISSVIFYSLGLANNENPYFATAVNLSDYFAITVFMISSFISIIGHQRDRVKLVLKMLFTSFALYLIPVWIPLLLNLTEWILIGHVVANAMLVICMVSTLGYGYIVYVRALKRLDNFYSDNARGHISWLAKSIFLFIGLAIIAAISPFSHHYSIWLRTIYLGFQLCAYLYIHVAFKRYEATSFALLYAKTIEEEEFATESIEKCADLSKERSQSIKKGINEWTKSKRYCTQGVTLKSVAADMCTNRTYLSSYINTTYQCSFKVWITKLRIDEAKRLLSDNKGNSVNIIATKVGFASASSFIHTFTNMEGISPIKWRGENRGSKEA